MKRAITIFTLVLAAAIFQNCGSSKKAAAPVANATTSFSKDVMPIMQASCTPCHFPPDGRVEPLDNYDGVKRHIGEIIERVKLPQSSERFMPFRMKKPALTTEQMALLEKWKTEGMPE